ncbi:hypothetical protein C3L33_06335, partial [Rhododendron williamsianum]
MDPKRTRNSPELPDSSESTRPSPFPDEVLEAVLSLMESHKDRSSVSLVCRDWYNAERYTRSHVFIGNCYSVSPEIVGRRFPRIRSVTLKGKPRNLTELDIQENEMDDNGGGWLSCFPEDFTSLEVLNFSSLHSDVSFDALERLVSRCKLLRVLKVNRNVNLEQLQRLLLSAPQLTELGTGSFQQELTTRQFADIEFAFSKCKNLQSLSGLWEATSLYLHVIFPACASLTFLNLSYATLQVLNLPSFFVTAQIYGGSGVGNIQFSIVLDTVEDKGLEAVGSTCPLLEELRVFPADPFDQDIHHGVTESVQNCPDFTHFRLCIMNPCQPDYLTNEPLDEAFGAVVKTCTKLQRLSVSGLLTDLTFEYIGKYAKNLETLSVAFAGSSDWGMECVLGGCPKLRKLEIRDCPFGNAALLSGLEKYESMRSLWMSACNVTLNGCRLLATGMPRLNVEVMKEDESDELADKVYVYRSVAGPRRDAPPFVLTL